MKDRVAVSDLDILGGQFRVAFTRETRVEKAMGAAKLVRVKSRRSRLVGQWRIDCTAVTTLPATGLTAAALAAARASVHGEGRGATYEIEIEYVGQGPTDLGSVHAAATALLRCIDPANEQKCKHGELIAWAGAQMGTTTTTLKTLLCQAKGLSKEGYYREVFPPTGWFATQKLEGDRALVCIRDSTVYIATANGLYQWPMTTTPATLLADAELLSERADDGPFSTQLRTAHCFVFDVLVGGLPFTERRKMIAGVVATLAKACPLVTWHEKEFVELAVDTMPAALTKLAAGGDFPIDGLILTSPGDLYSATRHIKWKPASQQSIDFIAMKARHVGQPPYDERSNTTLYLLFSMITHNQRMNLAMQFCDQYRELFPQPDPTYYPIQFSPPYNPLAYLCWLAQPDLHGKVIEVVRGPDDEWKLLRVRADRTQQEANNYGVAEATYANYIDEFKLENLWDDIYRAGNNFRRFVISTLLEKHAKGATWLFDMAAGRGADLHRYSHLGVKSVFCADIDPAALAELVSRRAKRPPGKKAGGGVLEPHTPIIKPPALVVHCMDFLADAAANLAVCSKMGVPVGSVDVIVCNFAIHYFCVDLGRIENIMLFADKLLGRGGRFIITCMDGKSVHKLVKAGPWQADEAGVVKYALRLEGHGQALAEAGQMISVKLPFAAEMKPEPQC
jgi:hypothetical protein